MTCIKQGIGATLQIFGRSTWSSNRQRIGTEQDYCGQKLLKSLTLAVGSERMHLLFSATEESLTGHFEITAVEAVA